MFKEMIHRVNERIDGSLDNPNDRDYLAMRYEEIKAELSKKKNCSAEAKAFLAEFKKAKLIDIVALKNLSKMLKESETLKEELGNAGEEDISSLIQMIDGVIADTLEKRSGFATEF